MDGDARGQNLLTIAQAWEDAKELFEQKSGRRPGDGKNVRKPEDVLKVLQDRYDAAPASEQKDDKLKSRAKALCWNVINGLSVLAKWSKPIAGAIYEPAGVCLEVTCFLLKVPGKIRDVFGGFSQLFESIQYFLIQFKIVNRINNGPDIPPELVGNTNKLMITFVRMCALCYKPIAGGRLAKIKIALSAALLKEDQGIHHELETFKSLCTQQNGIANAVTLEHVLRVENKLDDTIDLSIRGFENMDLQLTSLKRTAWEARKEQTVIGDNVRFLVTDSKERREQHKTAALLEDIADLLGSDVRNTSSLQVEAIQNYVRQRIPDSAAWMHENYSVSNIYKTWLDFGPEGHPVIALSGPAKSGKSYALARIWSELEEMAVNDSRLALAYYAFPKSDFKMVSKSQSIREDAIVTALKSLAFQVASKVSTYALELRDALTVKQTPESGRGLYRQYWDRLRFSSAKLDLTYVFYLEDIDELPADMQSKLLSLLSDYTTVNRLVRVRSVVTGVADSFSGNYHSTKAIAVPELNEKDVASYIARELFGDGVMTAFRRIHKDMIDGFQFGPVQAERDFSAIRSRIDRVKQAVEDLKPDKDIQEIMDQELSQEHENVASETIADLNANLKSSDVSELNEILTWVYYGPRYLTVQELEEAIHARGFHAEAKFLRQKLHNRLRYARLLTASGYSNGWVTFRSPELQRYLAKSEDKGPAASMLKTQEEPKMSLEIKIHNAPRSVVRQFMWDLNKKLNMDMDFFTQAEQSVVLEETIRLKTLESHSAIILQCLNLLTELPQAEYKNITAWAVCSLPGSLKKALEAEECTGWPLPNRQDIVAGLLALLTDVHVTVQHWQSNEYAYLNWLRSSHMVATLDKWLRGGEGVRDPAENLRASDKRRLRGLVNSSSPNRYLERLTVAIGREWLQNDDWDVWLAFVWIEHYLGMLEPKRASDRLATRAEKRVNRASEWLKKELKVDVFGALNLRRIAEVYVRFKRLPKAISIYKNAIALGKGVTRTRRSLALAYAANGEGEKAIEQMERVFEAYALSDDAGPKSDDELRLDHANCGTWHDTRNDLRYYQRYELSLPHFRQSVDFQNPVFARYVSYWRAAWRSQNESEMQVIQEQIKEAQGESSQSSRYLVTILKSMRFSQATGFLDDSLVPLSRKFKTERLLFESLREVVADAEDMELGDQIFHKLNMAIAEVMLHGKDREVVEECATRLRQYSVRLGDDRDLSGSFLHLRTANLSCQFFYDLAQAFPAHADHYLERMESDARRERAPQVQQLATMTATYLCRYYIQSGQTNKGRDLVSSRVKAALDLLVHDDPIYRPYASSLLKDTLQRVDDLGNYLSAFAVKTYEPGFMTFSGSSSGSESDSDSDSATVADKQVLPSADDWNCDGDCLAKGEADAKFGYSCCCCPDVDFCADCLKKLRNGSLERFICNAAHKFLPKPRWDPNYRDSVPLGHVQMGGIVTPPASPDGPWTREGGKIVRIDDWIDALGEEWGWKRSDRETEVGRVKPASL